MQAEGAARGTGERGSHQNSVGVQQLRQIVELLRSSELAGYIIKPRATHGVIQVYRLRRLAVPENKHITAILYQSIQSL